MFRLPPHRSLRPNYSRLFSTRHTFLLQQQPHPQYQAPTPDPTTANAKPNPHRELYKKGGIGRPVAKNFLIAMVTFQVLYWSWLKLESVEVKMEKGEEVRRLESEVRRLESEVKSLTGFGSTPMTGREREG